MRFCQESQGSESFFDKGGANASTNPIWNHALFITRQGRPKKHSMS